MYVYVYMCMCVGGGKGRGVASIARFMERDRRTSSSPNTKSGVPGCIGEGGRDVGVSIVLVKGVQTQF